MPTLDTTIIAVTVYPKGARITRQGKLTVQAGEQTISLIDLPWQLEQESVRVNGRGVGVKILGVDVQQKHLPAPTEADTLAERAQLETLQAQDKALEDDERILQTRAEALHRSNQQHADALGKMIAYKRATPQDFLDFARFISEQEAQGLAQQRELALKRRDLQREIAALEQKLNSRGGAGGQRVTAASLRRYDLHVRIHAAEPTLFELEALYSTTYAGWTPLYDLRLQEEGKVELTYLAEIKQNAGEDWRGVQLTVSTAQQTVKTTLPELSPQYIHSLADRQRKQAESFAGIETATGGDAKRSFMLARAAAPAEAPVAEIVTAEVSSEAGTTAVSFKVKTPFSAPADGTAHKTTITIEGLSAALDYWVVPKLALEAYLRAIITNTSEATLVPGTASIYHGDMFVGKTTLKTIAPSEEFEVQLGSDDRIRVKRDLIQRDVNKRFIGGARTTTVKYKITLTNLRTTSATVILHDQIPQSVNEQIKVKLLEATPALSEQTPLNLLKWELTLKPNEKREVFFAFQVEHPAEMQVIGLE